MKVKILISTTSYTCWHQNKAYVKMNNSYPKKKFFKVSKTEGNAEMDKLDRGSYLGRSSAFGKAKIKCILHLRHKQIVWSLKILVEDFT